MRSSITAVASAVCSESVALASVASLACAVAAFSSIVRRTEPHRSGAQLTLPSSEPELFTDWKLLNPALAPLLLDCWSTLRCRVHRAGDTDGRKQRAARDRTSASASW